MSRNLLSKLSTVIFGSACGVSVYYCLKSSKSNSKEFPEISTCEEVRTNGVEWDYNWDKRDAKSIVKPPAKGEQWDQKELEKHRPKVTRHIILIRHGQFKKGEIDIERTLTKLGHQQAQSTGKRLAEMDLPITELIVSTLARARETGKIILDQLPKKIITKYKEDEQLVEGAPIQPQPICDWGDWAPEPHRFFKDGSRIEAAFRAYFHRADPSQEKDSYTVLVCHSNVIRYFICRALQFPPEAWIRFDLNHASITWLVLRHDGVVFLRMFGSSGHFPEQLITSVNE